MRRVLLTAVTGVFTLLGLSFIVPGTALAQQYPPLTSCYSELMDIGVGDPCVGSVQIALNTLGIPNPRLRVDHIYGSATKSAVMAFQGNNDLRKDGVAGRDTITKLYEATRPPSQSASAPVSAPAPATSTCTTAHESVNFNYPVTHTRLWAFNMNIHYCYSNGSIVSVDNPDVYGTVTGLGKSVGWEYVDGKADDKQEIHPSGPLGPGESFPEHAAYEISARGNFQDCPPGVKVGLPCVREIHPVVKLHIEGTGNWSGTSSQS
jgi:peptidoglycan hydrolase-like protein with peptidoglycan-binding domain